MIRLLKLIVNVVGPKINSIVADCVIVVICVYAMIVIARGVSERR